jgi:hypothetical protein
MSRLPGVYGIAYWLRVGEWLRGQKYLLTLPPYEAMQKIRRHFNVSRATAYRYLAAWREVNPEKEHA